MEKESIKQKAISGILWSAADAFLGQGVTFIIGLVLARLLSPDEYGLIGICLIFNTILNGVVDSGFSNAIIRKKNATDSDYNTMFITNFIISFALYIILFLSTPYISIFFGRVELTTLIRVTGIILIINALGLTHNTKLSKMIDFRKKTIASFLSAIISGTVGILMALMGFGVWSLVGQIVSRQFVYTACCWSLVKWYPHFSFDLNSFHYMWGFGWKLLISGLLSNLWNQMYQAAVAKFYSPATLGQYTRSKEYARLFSENLTIIVQRVSYPVLSEIQDNEERLVEGYRRIIKVTMFITAISMLCLGAISEPLIYCLIGPQWHEAATYLPLICISMSLYPLHAINLNMLQVQGRSDLYLYLEIVKKIIAVIPICIGIFISIYAMLYAIMVTGVLSFFLNSYYTGKKLGYTSLMQLKDVAADYAVAFVIALSVYFIKFIPTTCWIILGIQIVVIICMFFIICEKLKLEEYLIIKEIGKSYLKKLK